MNKRLYIAYGSNLNFRQMSMRCPTAKLMDVGEIEGYELRFKGNSFGAHATIGRLEGGNVPVAVWDIKPSDERALDGYEGYPRYYFKENLPVKLQSGEEISAMVYIMNLKMEFGLPDARYYNLIREGYENCGFDLNILTGAMEKSINAFSKAERERLSAAEYDDEFEDIDESSFEEEDSSFSLKGQWL
jgi:hypothetical protein